MDRKVSFLFGAGISKQAGLKLGYDLTNNLIKSFQNDFRMDTVVDNKKLPNIKIIKSDFKKLVATIDKYLRYQLLQYDKHFQPNYEDYYFIIGKLMDLLDGDELYLFVDILNKINDTLNFEYKNYPEYKLIKLLSISDYYIREYLMKELFPYSTTDYLEPIINYLKQLDRAYIFTLNYDLIFDDLISNNNLNYHDGFIPKDKFLKWDLQSFDINHNKVYLKLHGSLNWRILSNGEYPNSKIAKTSGIIKDLEGLSYKGNSKLSFTKDRIDGSFLSNHSHILVGSDNKAFDYNYGVFLDLMYLFKKYLDNTDVLVIIGYSFADLVINQRIIDWLVRNKMGKIIIINPVDSDLLIKNSRGTIKDRFDIFSNRITFYKTTIDKFDFSIID